MNDAAFLRTQLDEDEVTAKALGGADLTSQVMTVTRAVDDYTDRFGPARVLREIETVRAIIALCETETDETGGRPLALRVLRHLADIYSDDPDIKGEQR